MSRPDRNIFRRAAANHAERGLQAVAIEIKVTAAERCFCRTCLRLDAQPVARHGWPGAFQLSLFPRNMLPEERRNDHLREGRRPTR